MHHLTVPQSAPKGERKFCGAMLNQIGALDGVILTLPDGPEKEDLIEKRAKKVDILCKRKAALEH
jgi:hypothetical protein